MKQKDLLRQLGFSRLAEKIYHLLLKNGPLSIAEIARQTASHRPAVYGTLPELLENHLISSIKLGRRLVYDAESPNTLLAIVKTKTQLLDENLPSLLKSYENKNQSPKISFFECRAGIESAYEYLIGKTKKGGLIYRYESPKDHQQNKRFYPTLYWQRAGADGDLEKFVITNAKTHQSRRQNINRLSKAVPTTDDLFDYNITQIISDTMVLFVDYDSETAFLIENDRFAAFHKRLFKLLFNKL